MECARNDTVAISRSAGQSDLAMGGAGQRGTLSSNGKLVNVGNFDRDGANVNDWNPRNSNDDIGVVLSRSVA